MILISLPLTQSSSGPISHIRFLPSPFHSTPWAFYFLIYKLCRNLFFDCHFHLLAWSELCLHGVGFSSLVITYLKKGSSRFPTINFKSFWLFLLQFLLSSMLRPSGCTTFLTNMPSSPLIHLCSSLFQLHHLISWPPSSLISVLFPTPVTHWHGYTCTLYYHCTLSNCTVSSISILTVRSQTAASQLPLSRSGISTASTLLIHLPVPLSYRQLILSCFFFV